MTSRPPRRLRRPRARTRGARGAVAVEAALTLPLVLIVLFGVVEFSFLLRDDLAVTSAVRSGGRIASASVTGNGCTTGSTCGAATPHVLPALAVAGAAAMARDSTSIPKDANTQVWFYLADAAGYPGTATSMPADCPTNCVRMKWDAATSSFVYLSGSWDYSSINACVNSGSAVGVYMTLNHRFTTGLFGTTVNLNDHSVFAVEPLEQTNCGPGVRP